MKAITNEGARTTKKFNLGVKRLWYLLHDGGSWKQWREWASCDGMWDESETKQCRLKQNEGHDGACDKLRRSPPSQE